jgi:hypothetical protein
MLRSTSPELLLLLELLVAVVVLRYWPELIRRPFWITSGSGPTFW